MQRATQNDAQRWIAEAEKDLKDAELLLPDEGYYPLCRLAYLAAEKAIRALVLGKNLHVADRPTLGSLGQQLEAAEPALGSLMTSLRPLQQFAPPAQRDESEGTPRSHPLYSREAAKGALALARQAVITATRYLTTSP
jgi:HEPN domain-containing protein